MFGPVEMGDHAAFEAFGAMMAEAEHLELHVVACDFEPIGRGPGSRDQAADLARANVERAHDALALATIETRLPHPPCPHLRYFAWCLTSARREGRCRCRASSVPP